jgi:ABC-type multidrug transport system ATPase subunit
LKIIDNLIVLHNGENVYNGSPNDMVDRLTTFEGIEFPNDGNIAEHLLRQINSNSCVNGAKNVKSFQGESRSLFNSQMIAIRGEP